MTSRRDAPVVAVVQARMSSRRLPRKVLADLGGATTLEMVVGRLRQARELDGVIVATSVEPSDDPVEAAVRSLGCDVHRGPLDDVLGRFGGAVEAVDAEAVVRVTADCPFVAPTIVDALVSRWRNCDAEYVSNVIAPFSFPMGLNAEVVGREALLTAIGEATDAADREHVTTYIRARPEQFPSAGLWMRPALPEAVVTLDTEEDLKRIRDLVGRVGTDPGLGELLASLGLEEPAEFVEGPPAA